MAELDERIKLWYEQGLGCRQIGSLLGEDPTVVYRRVRRVGLIRTRDEASQVAPKLPLPFRAEVREQHLRIAAIGEAASWFLQRGYVASVPLAVAQYDLIAESDDGLVRVQVKTTTRKERGRWVVDIARRVYEASVSANANGARRRQAYRTDEIDMFFIITGDASRYLVPLEATGGVAQLTLDDKYAAYRV
jgi:hypothetical protein